MILADYHLHTDFSSDSNTPMELMVENAIDRGLKTICFTDHMDLDYPVQIVNGVTFDFQLDINRYVNKISEVKKIYSDKIEIFSGIELGMQPYLADRYRNVLKDYDFDFILSSSHLIYGVDPYYKEFWDEHDTDTVYREYFEEISENVKNFSDFNVYGHIDYIVRYGPERNAFYTYEKFADVIDYALKTIIENGKGIEVNSSGFKYKLGFPHPQTDVLRRYRELGGEIITIGSDAHVPEFISYEFETVREILLSVGFKYYTTFCKRLSKFHKL